MRGDLLSICRSLLAGVALAIAWPGNCLAAPQETPPPADRGPAPQADDREAPAADRSSPWLLLPVVSSNPKLGTSFGGAGAYLHTFGPGSRVSLFGATYQYTSTDSSIGGVLARTSFGADHHRIIALAAFGRIKNDYDDYLGTGQSLQTNDDMVAATARYLYRLAGNWFVGAHGIAANYQVFGESAEDDLVVETLGLRGFKSVAVGAVVMHDSRDNEDMPIRGWLLKLNNLASREELGASQSFDAYRADARAFWSHGRGHVLAVRQNNWLTHEAPLTAQATVVLRGYKLGQYLAPYMSSLEGEERVSFGHRLGATVFGGVAALYGERDVELSSRQFYPTWGVGLHFVIKPAEHMLANFEYAQGVENNRGLYLKFGYGW